MNPISAFAVIAVAVAISVGALLLVRRRAPDGGYFTSGDRAAGMFGVLASGFAILLGFVVFLAFESFDESRGGAESEAVDRRPAVRDGAVPARRRCAAALSGELVCYARSVVGQEWPQMERGARRP